MHAYPSDEDDSGETNPQDVIGLGFLDYVEAAWARPAPKLFPAVKSDTRGGGPGWCRNGSVGIAVTSSESPAGPGFSFAAAQLENGWSGSRSVA